MLSLPIVKERLFSTVRKEAVLHYTCPRFDREYGRRRSNIVERARLAEAEAHTVFGD